MFILVALACMSADVRTCEIGIHKFIFVTEEGCVEKAKEYIGSTTSQGMIVKVSCLPQGQGA